MANLSLKHIYKVYPNGAKAVNDFSMEIADKEFIVFVGPSGCGKSTMLRMIAGLEDITAGELSIGGAVVNGVEPKDRDIAMVFQNYALYPHMTIYDNIAFGLQTRRMPKGEIDVRVREAAEILGITDYLKRKPKEMSGGQRQRVALGRAIVREPKVMLLDEPLSNLDAKLRTQMRSEIVKLHDKLSTTFIYVTHDQVEAMTMGTRIVVMKSGFIQQIDTPRNLYNYPANKFVAGFIGTPQMNFFDCTLLKEGERVLVSFTGGGSSVRVPASAFLKMPPEYLDGKRPVTLGLRAEDISLSPADVENCSTVIDVKISHTEELGKENLVYADINLDYDGIAETDTRIIISSAGNISYTAGDVVKAALNFSAAHFFDGASEESILPRLPRYSYADGKVLGGALYIGDEKFSLPPACACEDGEYRLLIPTEAVIEGEHRAAVSAHEETDGGCLLTLKLGGRIIFALADGAIGEKADIGLDFKRITFIKDGQMVISPMPQINSFDGRLIMDKVVRDVETGGRLKRKKVAEYYIGMCGVRLAAPIEAVKKIFGAMTGRKAFNSDFTFELSPYDLTFADSGIPIKVLSLIDYGGEKFARCRVDGGICYVKCGASPFGEKFARPSLERLGVIEKARQIRII